jgi:hypothetical protein
MLHVLEQNNPGREIRVPTVDFARREIYLFALGPRSSTGYELRILRIEDLGSHILVVLHERTPSLGDVVQARLTYPFRLISLPLSDKAVKPKLPGRP